MKKMWTGKKEPTNEKKKIAHKERVPKKVRLRELQEEDWEEQVKEYNANQSFQE